jgi:D-amino-acid dehydrogenase
VTQKQIAVVGGGVVGICTAYFLAQAGHEVVVIERHHNVAQEASFANPGIISPGYATPWAAPGMPRKILSALFRSESPVLLKPTLDRTLWRWGRKWLAECAPERYQINKERMQRIALYSQEILQQLHDTYQLDYEQTQGILQVFRTERDIAEAKTVLDLLQESGVAHQLVDADGARAIEPALGKRAGLAGGLYLPKGESGNSPLFAKHMKQVAQSIGVHFHFTSTVRKLEPDSGRINLHIEDNVFPTDAVVLAAGVDSAQLLRQLGINVPLYPVKGYSATAVIKDFEEAPRGAVLDESYKTAITRMGNRIRIAGTAELGFSTAEMHKAALRTLIKVGVDWFPNAANYNTSSFWAGARPMLPDGPPLLGATPLKNLYINIGHGSTGWAMAAGCGKVVADIISGRTPEIDMDGLTLSRYG